MQTQPERMPVALPQAPSVVLSNGDRPAFGTAFTRSMVTALHTAEEGWGELTLSPRQPLTVDPAMVGIHYGQAVFEGLKAYRIPEGGLGIFRPRAHAERLRASAARLAIPAPPMDLVLDGISALARADVDLVPDSPDRAMYLRPLLVAADPSLALRPADTYLLLLIAFITGDFFADGTESISVWIEDRYVRAAAGGAGDAKAAGNYAPTYLAQSDAAALGCQQVVWLDAHDRRWVEEMGGMNLFFVRRRAGRTALCTPPLSGTILAGVTRDTILTLARDRGVPTAELPLSVEEWRTGCETGEITEVFACGTAAGITPVGSVVGRDGRWTVGDGRPGPLTIQLRGALRAVQRGEAADRHGWLVRI
ncbi:branched-chain amino acid aminotransferase [Micromonospora sp. NPDC049051]|uniref:branched-chain amino acid aminotransferase n=1 Tax=Micromonospora sp. NPDC049051 TaxID=3364264 RepID=UPI0037235316